MTSGPLADVRLEGERIVGAAAAQGLTVRLCGGAAIAHLCPSAALPPLAREYKDVDVVALRSERKAVAALIVELGYEASDEFNLLNGSSRLLFWDAANARQLDVLLDNFEMCHSLELARRLRKGAVTLDPADLLLTKLQVRETNERDVLDALALVVDAEPDIDRIAALLCDDWGWWKTATEVLGRIADAADVLEREPATTARRWIEALEREVTTRPKSVRWRTRALVGERIRWYEEPDDTY